MSVGRYNFLIYGIKSDDYHEFVPKSEKDSYYGQEKIVHAVEVDDIWKLEDNDFRKDPKLVILQDGYDGSYSILGILLKYVGNIEYGDGDFNEVITKNQIDFLHGELEKRLLEGACK